MRVSLLIPNNARDPDQAKDSWSINTFIDTQEELAIVKRPGTLPTTDTPGTVAQGLFPWDDFIVSLVNDILYFYPIDYSGSSHPTLEWTIAWSNLTDSWVTEGPSTVRAPDISGSYLWNYAVYNPVLSKILVLSKEGKASSADPTIPSWGSIVSLALTGSDFYTGLAVCNGYYIALRRSGSLNSCNVYRSSDGTSWIFRATLNVGTYTPKGVLAIGTTCAFFSGLYSEYSTDSGSTWNSVFINQGVHNTGVVFLNKFTLFGDTTVITSSDAISWSTIASSPISSQYCRAACSATIVVLADTFSTTNTVYWSTDAITWNAVTLSTTITLATISYTGSMFIITPHDPSAESAYYSTDGQAWTPFTLSSPHYLTEGALGLPTQLGSPCSLIVGQNISGTSPIAFYELFA